MVWLVVYVVKMIIVVDATPASARTKLGVRTENVLWILIWDIDMNAIRIVKKVFCLKLNHMVFLYSSRGSEKKSYWTVLREMRKQE